MNRFARSVRGWRWRTSLAGQPGSGCVDFGRARFWVDPDDTATVVAAEASDLEGLTQLEPALGRGWAESMVQLGPSAESDDPALAPSPLSSAWARLALVLAVAQWSPQTLDDSILAVDQALAWDDCGHTRAAAALLTLAQDTVADLWTSYQLGELPSPAQAPLRLAAARLAASPAADAATREILASPAADHFDDSAPLGGDPPTDIPWPSRSGIREGQEGTAQAPPGLVTVVDPRFVHPRLLVWRARRYDVSASAVAGAIVVQAAVADDVPDDAHELRTLFAVLLDARTGELLARGSFNNLDPDGTATSLLDFDPPPDGTPLLASVGNADLVASAARAGVRFEPAGSDAARAAEQFARWVDLRTDSRRASTALRPQDNLLLAELLAADALPRGSESGGSPHLTADLDDAEIERVLSEWRLDIDLLAALTRDQDPTPTFIDLQHSDVTHDSRCTGGQQFFDDLAGQGIHPRLTWRYCANPTSLTVRAQLLPGQAAGAVELQLSAGAGWTAFVDDDDGYLVARTRPREGEQILVRAIEPKPR